MERRATLRAHGSTRPLRPSRTIHVSSDGVWSVPSGVARPTPGVISTCLVFVRDRDFDRFIAAETNGYWSTADRFIDPRRNAPAGATYIGSIYIRSGLPVGVDWYVYPFSMAAWPDDCEIRSGADAAPRAGASFADWNGRGPRQAPLDEPVSGRAADRLTMVPIAAKYIRGGRDLPCP